MCCQLLPELTYRTYVGLCQKGIIDALERVLGRRVDSVQVLAYALISFHNIRFVNKACIATGLASSIYNLTSEIDYVYHTFCSSTLLEKTANLVGWMVDYATRRVDSCSDMGALFTYAAGVFKACLGDFHLFQACIGTIFRVFPINPAAGSKLFLTHLAAVADAQPVMFSLRFIQSVFERFKNT